MTMCAGIGLLFAGLTSHSAHAAALRLPAIISDHAMIQAGKPVAVWGWATPGEEVTVEFAAGGKKAQITAKAGGDGRWNGQLPAVPDGTAGDLEVRTKSEGPIKVSDVLAGEVWLCGGQSNMSYLLTSRGRNPNETTGPEILQEAQKKATEANGALRYFAVASKRSDDPLDDVQGKWFVAAPDNVGNCFSLSWNFAVALQDKAHLPVGVIDSAIGGTAIEPWTPLPELEACPAGPSTIQRYKAKQDKIAPDIKSKFDAEMAEWVKRYPTAELQKENLASKPVMPDNNMPARLYNGMIHGLEPYTLKGCLWFQGDGNFGNPQEYGELVKTLIRARRSHWHDDALPFYYVEMQNYRPPQKDPVEPNPMSLIREAQQGALELPNTDVAASLDQGIDKPNYEPHFPSKKQLGERLAGLALDHLYGQSGLVHSPAFKSYTIEGNKVRVKLDYADGLRLRGDAGLRGFAIRGEGGDWQWAQGKIEGEEIVLWNDQIAKPVAVRYAWAFNPLLSVENKAGLPLRPFRTDRESEK
jgi:sialate O-acetylesterase